MDKSCSILGLIKDLAKQQIFQSGNNLLNERAPQLGQKPLDVGLLNKKLTMKIYEGLLTKHGLDNEDHVAEMTVYDRLYAVCFEKRLQNRMLEAEKLEILTDTVFQWDSTHYYLRNGLQFLLYLKQECSPDMPEIGQSRFLRYCHDVDMPIYSYPHYQSQLFEKVQGNCSFQNLCDADSFDSKVFSMVPGLSLSKLPLKCNHVGSSYPSKREHLSNNLFAALSRSVSDPWSLETKLELPELSDVPSPSLEQSLELESGPLERARRTFEVGLISLAKKNQDKMQIEEDEGFKETDTTPSSIASLGRTIENSVEIWDLASSKDFLQMPRAKYKAWESLGCSDPVLEKPFLTEAGPVAFDNLVFSQRQVLSILCPEVCVEFQRCRPSDVMVKSLYALIGISSDLFCFDESTVSLIAAKEVCISGLSPESVHNILVEFATSGTHHLRLEKLVDTILANNENCGTVWRAFVYGVRSYLYHRQVVISDLIPNKERMKIMDEKQTFCLLHLVEDTARLRFQTRFLAELCMLTDKFGLFLPPGVHLLSHLFSTTLPSVGNPDTFPLVLSLLRRTAEPYFYFLRTWAFEGRHVDRNNEFTIQVNSDAVEADDIKVWNESFSLKVEDDPILGPLLAKVLVCGKSLYLLKRCYPLHHLCRQNWKFPTLTLVFSESELSKVDKECREYATTVSNDVNHLKLLRKRQEEEERNTREALIKKMQQLKTKNASKAKTKPSESRSPEYLTADTFSSHNIEQPKLRVTELNTRSVSDTIDDTDIIRDDNANPVEFEQETTNHLPDWNANEEAKSLPISCDLISPNNQNNPNIIKGTKRKQDRLSIDFEMREARRPVKVTFPELSTFGKEDESAPSEKSGILVEGSTFQLLRTRGRSTHGHSSDSSIQKLMYGSVSVGVRHNEERIEKNGIERTELLQPESHEETLNELSMKFYSVPSVIPYQLEYPEFEEFPMSDVARGLLSETRKSDDICSVENEDFWNKLNLPDILNRCIKIPLQTQISLMDRSLLDYFLNELRLIEHFSFLQNHFFMQDGEFSQCVCDLLFERISKSTSPSNLLNPLTLNSILSKAFSYSSSGEAERDFEAKTSFVVKEFPSSFKLNSPDVLDCLRLNYRVGFPTNIVLSADMCTHYEHIFSFLLQLRYCLWASTDTFRILKLRDPTSSTSASSFYNIEQYRLLQLYRHEMHHFLRCLHEHLNLQAFQATSLKFKADIHQVASLEELISLHSKYLNRVSFRCLLNKKAATLLKALRNVFFIVLKFRALLLYPVRNNNYTSDMAKFTQLQSSYKAFKDNSSYLFQVVTMAVHRGYQNPLEEFLTKLDCSNWYSSQGAEMKHH